MSTELRAILAPIPIIASELSVIRLPTKLPALDTPLPNLVSVNFF
jgi:hypothetical protein